MPKKTEVSTEKIRIQKTYSTVYIDGCLGTAIKELTDLKTRLENQGWVDLRINLDISYGDPIAEVAGRRWETDREFKFRLRCEENEIENEKRRNEKRKTDDTKSYKRLYKKFKGANPSEWE